jgi:hypothetical protein
MAEAARSLPSEIQELIDLQEWDMRTREGIRRQRELGAKSLPSIALDGELVFESIIPGQEELTEAILKRHQNRSVR